MLVTAGSVTRLVHALLELTAHGRRRAARAAAARGAASHVFRRGVEARHQQVLCVVLHAKALQRLADLRVCVCVHRGMQ